MNPFLLISFRCPTCLGKRGQGHDSRHIHRPWQDCAACQGTGHTTPASLSTLTPAQLHFLREEIAALDTPPDPEAAYEEQSAREHLTRLLSKKWIETIHLPSGPATHLDLFGKFGPGIRIFPEKSAGRFIAFNARVVERADGL